MNINLEGLDKLGEFGNQTFGNMITSLGVLAIFCVILFAIVVVFLWVFGSIGLMNLAKKNNIPNGWLAFLPIGRSYIIAKLGFETYGDKNNQNNKTFMWITFGLGVVSFLLTDSDGDLHRIINYGLLFFECWAFYNMFKNLKQKNAIVYTVFTALTKTLLGGLFLYLLKPDEVIEEAQVVEEKKEIKMAETKEEKTKSNFCEQCGTKLTKSAKFCPECGKEIK